MKRLLLIGLILVSGCVNRQTIKRDEQQKELAKIQFSDASGDSYEDAVVIMGVEKQSQGMDAEYSYISKKHGKEK